MIFHSGDLTATHRAAIGHVGTGIPVPSVGATLALDFCPAGHGFWLDAAEDKRVLELMRREELREKWSHKAEDAWGAHLRFWSARGFFGKLKAMGDFPIDGT